jgi:simple sugar transport system substrate-binding protein
MALAAVLPIVSVASTPALAADKLKVTMIYTSVARDGGWYQAFDDGRLHLIETFGDKIEIEYKENVPEGPQSSTSYGYGQPMLDSAAKHSDVHFITSQWDNPGNLDNFVGFVNAPEDGAYVAGVAAGHIIKKGGKVGWVDAFPIPYDIRTINGFALGLARSNPTATVQVVFTNDWVDTNKQARAVRSLIDAGVDFVATSLTSSVSAEVAESEGIPVVSPALDGRPYAPKMSVTSFEYRWGYALAEILQTIMDGKFSTEFNYSGMKIGAVDMAEWGGAYNALSDEAKADIQAEYDRIRSGKGEVFTGPLKDKNGNQVLAEGEVMSVAKLRGMDFVLPNVNGVEF